MRRRTGASPLHRCSGGTEPRRRRRRGRGRLGRVTRTSPLRRLCRRPCRPVHSGPTERRRTSICRPCAAGRAVRLQWCATRRSGRRHVWSGGRLWKVTPRQSCRRATRPARRDMWDPRVHFTIAGWHLIANAVSLHP